jgi:hypothetical protein
MNEIPCKMSFRVNGGILREQPNDQEVLKGNYEE